MNIKDIKNNKNVATSDLSESYGSHQSSREDLKAFASSACVNIYDDFDAAEIAQQPRSVRLAWSYGRMLRCENNEDRRGEAVACSAEL